MTTCSICPGSALIFPIPGARRIHQLNIFSDHAAEHFIKVGYKRIDVQNLWLEDLFATEGEQLAR